MTDPFSPYRDPSLLVSLASALSGYKGGPLRFMEVCGTHTMAIQRFGIRSALPASITMVSGPGCPVCVTGSDYIDTAVELAGERDVVIATFGDLLRVPGSRESLLHRRSEGADIRVVYSPLDTLEICRENPGKRVVFLSVGFETTVPVIALLAMRALENGVRNLFLLTANKTMPRALETLVSGEGFGIDGFLFPGHVCSITGTSYFEGFCGRYGIPGAIAGFEPADILGAVQILVDQVLNGTSLAVNAYRRVVKREGNPHAMNAVHRVFGPCDAVWRGIGVIPGSGLALKGEYAGMDARRAFGLTERIGIEPEGCLCGEILRGRVLPTDCPLFGGACTPEAPVGPCMVSPEGSCAAYHKYR